MYEIYTSIPVMSKWVRVVNNGATPVTVSALTTDVLYPTNEALGYWPHVVQGSLVAATSTGRIHYQNEMTRGGQTISLNADSRCTMCTQGSSLLMLSSAYPPGAANGGPAAQIGTNPGTAFHGNNFTSFYTYMLLHDSDDSERQGLAVRKMYRTLAPQITENPIFMHLTDATPLGIQNAVDQCAEVGFEMIMLSFGTMTFFIDNVIMSIA